MTPESKLKNEVIARLKALRKGGRKLWWCRLSVGGVLWQQVGLPDMLIVRDGGVLFIELKAERGKLTRIQRKVREDIIAAGGRYETVRDVSELDWMLDF